jgi:photosystem II stability/assembly factor-like uncharacterized protein
MRSKYLAAFLGCASLLLSAQQVTTPVSHTTESLRGLSANSSIIWASGTHGTYLISRDEGSTWATAQVPGAEALDFRDVEAFGATNAYLLAAGPGEQSRIYKTTDAGVHWTLQFTNANPDGFFDCMGFWDPDHGIAVGDPVKDPDGKLKFELIATVDGGKNWNPIPTTRLPPAITGEGAFAASGTCLTTQGKNNVWFVTGGSAARVFRSTDRSQRWTVSDTPITHGPASAGIFSIAFRDPQHGIIAGGDYKEPGKGTSNLAATEDGGATWKLLKVSPQSYISGVAITGKHGLIVTGSSHTAVANSQNSTSWSRIWDFNLNSIALEKNGKAVAVGPKGLIVVFKNLK